MTNHPVSQRDSLESTLCKVPRCRIGYLSQQAKQWTNVNMLFDRDPQSYINRRFTTYQHYLLATPFLIISLYPSPFSTAHQLPRTSIKVQDHNMYKRHVPMKDQPPLNYAIYRFPTHELFTSLETPDLSFTYLADTKIHQTVIPEKVAIYVTTVKARQINIKWLEGSNSVISCLKLRQLFPQVLPISVGNDGIVRPLKFDGILLYLDFQFIRKLSRNPYNIYQLPATADSTSGINYWAIFRTLEKTFSNDEPTVFPIQNCPVCGVQTESLYVSVRLGTVM